jgi:cysteine desulfurase family protein
MSSTPKSELYFDNAATSFPKPPNVEKAILDYLRNVGASAGRGAYPRAMQSRDILDTTRQRLAQLFNISTPQRIIFTLNASDALNLAIKGIDWKPGDTAVVSAMEHNSVLRPLNALKKKIGIRVVKVAANAEGWVDPAGYAQTIDATTKLVGLVYASNVSGTIQPITEVGALARARGIPFLVDAAQAAGGLPIDVEAMNIDLLAVPGHKGLLGAPGTGALYIRDGIDLECLREGGTGSVSEHDVQPDFLPDKYEAGSHNTLGLAGLKAGVEFLLETGVANVRAHEEALISQFLKGARDIPGLTVYGPAEASRRVAVLSVRLKGYAPLELAHKLFESSGVMTRAGLHCAPGAHQAIGTYPIGSTRFSFGYFTSAQDVDAALSALTQLAPSLAPSAK